jgi:hypothetical protein
VNRLIELGADIYANNQEAFRNAVHNGHIEIVIRLIELGADIDIAIKCTCNKESKAKLLKIKEEYCQPLVKSALMVYFLSSS